MRMILHAGTHKTGTSSIQAAFAENREWLAERGYVFALGGRNHNGLARSIAQSSEEERRELGRSLSRSVGANAAAILSAEEISARIAGLLDWEGYNGADHWERKAAYLRHVKDVLADFDDIAVHLCFRRPDDLAESLYSTLVIANEFSGTFEQFLEALAPLFAYRRQIDAFEGVFGQVQIVSFERLADRLIPKFCEWTKIPTPPGRDWHRKQTPDKRLIHWFLRTTGPNPHDRHSRRLCGRFVRSGTAADLFADRPRSTFWRDEATRAAFAAEQASGLPSGFFPEHVVRASEPADLDEKDFDRVTAAFADWRSEQSQWTTRLSRLWTRVRKKVS